MIAQSEAREVELVKDPLLAKQNWKNVLVDKCVDIPIDLAWIDLLLDTGVASFSPDVWRTGTFVYIKPGDFHPRNENQFQPDIEWFVECGVPVWYRWDQEAASLPKNQYLAPLEFQIQDADSFMHKSLPPPASCGLCCR